MGTAKRLAIGLAITLILAAAVLGGAGIIGYSVLGSTTTTPAYLDLHGPSVKVDRGQGWESATDEMELDAHDTIQTNQDSAELILHESVIISLFPGTEARVADLSEEHPRLQLDKGTAWSKFTGLLGITSYQIETPNTVATVRGTAFKTAFANGTATILVGEGLVEVNAQGEVLSITPGQKAVKDADPLRKEELTPTEFEWLENAMQETIEHLRSLRWREIHKHQKLLDLAQERYDFDDNDLRIWLEQIDRGELDDEKLLEQAPFKPDALYRIKDLNDQIKKQQEAAALFSQ